MMPADHSVTADHAQRLDNLEIQLAFAEDLLEALNLTIARQAEQIEALTREVHDLRQRQQKAENSGIPRGRHDKDEAPPHY